MSQSRFKTGNIVLDDILGGGFLPGKKVIIYGSTGVGKTILGVTIAHAGIANEGHPGLIFDVSKGVDSQSQIEYARKFFKWSLKNERDITERTSPNQIANYAYCRSNLEFMTPSETDVKNDFLRHHLPRTKRIVVDGSDPYSNAEQNPFFDQVRKFFSSMQGRHCIRIYKSGGPGDIDNPRYWNHFVNEEQVRDYCESEDAPFSFAFHPCQSPERERKQYEKPWEDEFGQRNYEFCWDRKLLGPNGKFPTNIRDEWTDGADNLYMLLQTTKERSIFDLINRPIEVGSLDAEINTVIVMGYFPVAGADTKIRRGLAVVKHRGSNYDTSIFEYEITNKGINIINTPN